MSVCPLLVLDTITRPSIHWINYMYNWPQYYAWTWNIPNTSTYSLPSNKRSQMFFNWSVNFHSEFLDLSLDEWSRGIIHWQLRQKVRTASITHSLQQDQGNQSEQRNPGHKLQTNWSERQLACGSVLATSQNVPHSNRKESTQSFSGTWTDCLWKTAFHYA